FHRANQALWGTASDGHAWGAEANSSSIFSINNNAGQVAGGTGPHSAVLGPTASNAEVLFAGSVNSWSGANIGAVVRFVDTNDWYKAYLEGSNLVEIGRASCRERAKVSVGGGAINGNE